MSFTLVSFHAHPDDEALLTGGTLARAAAEGHRVVIVVATAGEAGLTERPDDLAARRVQELQASAQALGCARVEVLGYGDSGSGPETPRDAARDRARFADVDPWEPAERLAEILREEHADVLTVYDARGGYGHPDHVQVHRVGVLAAQLAGTRVVLEATVDRVLLQRAAGLMSWIPGLRGLVPADRFSTAYLPRSRADPPGRRTRPPRREAGVARGTRDPDDRRPRSADGRAADPAARSAVAPGPGPGVVPGARPPGRRRAPRRRLRVAALTSITALLRAGVRRACTPTPERTLTETSSPLRGRAAPTPGRRRTPRLAGPPCRRAAGRRCGGSRGTVAPMPAGTWRSPGTATRSARTATGRSAPIATGAAPDPAPRRSPRAKTERNTAKLSENRCTPRSGHAPPEARPPSSRRCRSRRTGRGASGPGTALRAPTGPG